jgi:hypothetical protein
MNEKKYDKIIAATRKGNEAQQNRVADTLESIEAIHGMEAAMAVFALYDLNTIISRMCGILHEVGLPHEILSIIDDDLRQKNTALAMLLFHSILNQPIPSKENGIGPSSQAKDLNKTYVSMFVNFKHQQKLTENAVIKTMKGIE